MTAMLLLGYRARSAAELSARDWQVPSFGHSIVLGGPHVVTAIKPDGIMLDALEGHACGNCDDNSQRTTSYAADVPTTSSLQSSGSGADGSPSGVSVALTPPTGGSTGLPGLGRRML